MNYSCQSIKYGFLSYVNAHTYQETNFHEKERGGICMEIGFRLCILETVIGSKPIKIKKLLTILYKCEHYSLTYHFPF